MSPAGGEVGLVRALVCEDEPLAVRAIQEYLRDVAWVEIVGEARTGKEALRLIHKLEPDLVFMDVRMPGMSGVEVLEAVEHHPAVVFTTAYDEYALPAFDLGVVDYLVKPFGKERLLETLVRVRVRLVGEGQWGSRRSSREGAATPTYAQRLFARHRGATVPVAVSEIRHVEASQGGVAIHASSGSLEMDETLSEVHRRLDPADFVRIHRSHVVNLAHVADIRRYDERRLSVRLDDGTSLIASRGGSSVLRDLGV